MSRASSMVREFSPPSPARKSNDWSNAASFPAAWFLSWKPPSALSKAASAKFALSAALRRTLCCSLRMRRKHHPTMESRRSPEHASYQCTLTRKLAGCSGMNRVFFSNSGTEAIDGAMKLARLFGRQSNEAPATTAKKHRFLALENSFHGRTFGAITVTSTEKYRLPFAPVVPGAEFVRFNDLADLEAKFDDTVCGILLETIQGEGGIYPVSEVFWNRARSLASQHGARSEERRVGKECRSRWSPEP